MPILLVIKRNRRDLLVRELLASTPIASALDAFLRGLMCPLLTQSGHEAVQRVKSFRLS